MIPNVKYPFATYKNGFQNAQTFLEAIEKLKTNQKPFQFIVSRTYPNGKGLFNTNIKVSLENYTIKEDQKEGMDIVVSFSLKQYKDFGTKICKIEFPKLKNQWQKHQHLQDKQYHHQHLQIKIKLIRLLGVTVYGT